MAFLSQDELESIGFRSLGQGVKISKDARLYRPSLMDIGDNSRIDDFCLLAGAISIGRNVHLAAYSNIAAGLTGVRMDDFSGMAYGSQLIAESDDYSGRFMTNPTIPDKFRRCQCESIYIGRHCIIGASSIVLPGVKMGEGSSVGAMSLLTKATNEWEIYFGIPAKRIKSRKKDLLAYESLLDGLDSS